MNWLDEIARNSLAYLCVAAAGAALLGLLLFIRPHPRDNLLSPAPTLETLGGLEVTCAFLLMLIIPGMTRDLLDKIGFFAWWFEVAPSNDRKDLYVGVLFVPFFLAALHLILRRRSGISLVEVGLAPESWRRHVTLGYLFFLAATPIVLGIFFLSVFVLALFGINTVQHSIEKLGQENLFDYEWALIFIRVAVVAALTEELVFRGILQPWLVRSSLVGHAMLMAAVLAITVSASVNREWEIRFDILGFGLILVFEHALLLRSSLKRAGESVAHASSAQIAAIHGSAMLWAMFHVSAWPNPIPLYFMGLGLGMLAWRTQNLLGPIAWHSLFNSVAFLVLVTKPI